MKINIKSFMRNDTITWRYKNDNEDNVVLRECAQVKPMLQTKHGMCNLLRSLSCDDVPCARQYFIDGDNASHVYIMNAASVAGSMNTEVRLPGPRVRDTTVPALFPNMINTRGL